MSKTMMHIEGCKIRSSEAHNLRKKEFNYVRKDLIPTNDNWVKESIKNADKRIREIYQKNIGQKMQEKAKPIREGVVLIEPHHTMEDLKRLAQRIEDRFGIKTFQIHIHRDEGHWQDTEKTKWKSNLHAHMVFDWTNEQGKAYRLKSRDLAEIQDIVAEELEMERGKRSSLTHLNSIEYKIKVNEDKIRQKEKELQDLLNEQEKLLEKASKGIDMSELKNQDILSKAKEFLGINSYNEKKIQELVEMNNLLVKERQEDVIAYNNLINEMTELKIKNNELAKEGTELTRQIKHKNDQISQLLKEKVSEYQKGLKEGIKQGNEEIEKLLSDRKYYKEKSNERLQEKIKQFHQKWEQNPNSFSSANDSKSQSQNIHREVKKEEQQQEHKPRFRR